eukprot:3124116-Pleurochrysis_carterae.AAC.1
MAESADERAGAMFSSPTIPLSVRRGSGREAAARAAGGRTGEGDRAPRPGAGGCIGSTHPTVPGVRG